MSIWTSDCQLLHDQEFPDNHYYHPTIRLLFDQTNIVFYAKQAPPSTNVCASVNTHIVVVKSSASQSSAPSIVGVRTLRDVRYRFIYKGHGFERVKVQPPVSTTILRRISIALELALGLICWSTTLNDISTVTLPMILDSNYLSSLQALAHFRAVIDSS